MKLKEYFTDLDIRQSVLLLSLSISAIFLAVGIVSFISLGNFANRYDELKNDHLRAVMLLHQVDRAFMKLRLSSANYPVGKNIPIEQLRALDAELQSSIENGIASFAPMADTAFEASSLKEWQELYTKFLSLRSQQIELLANGREAEFIEFRIKVAIPHNRKAEEALDRLISHQATEASVEEVSVEQDIKKSRIVIGTLLFTSVILVGFLMWHSVNWIARVQSLRIEALNKSATIGMIAGDIAHEINNPLAVIVAAADTLEGLNETSEVDRARAAKLLNKIRVNSSRIQKVTAGMRAFARDGSADPFIELDLKNMIEESSALCGDKLKRHSVVLKFELPEACVHLEGRAVELSQVMVNLIANSIDAVSQLDDRWIQLSVVDRGPIIEIAVSDSGTGLPQAIREKMFKTSFTTKAIGAGTGLGLGICARIVAAHRGAIEIDEQSLNTRILISLPKKHIMVSTESTAV